MKSVYIIVYIGEHGAGLVDRDGDPVDSIDFAERFRTKKDAEERRAELLKTWTDSSLEVVEWKYRG